MDGVISPTALEAVVCGIFTALGCDRCEAALIAAQLVRANLLGHDSHGVGLVPTYVRMLREGKVKPNTRPEVVSKVGPVLVMDARRGFGQVAALEACRTAIDEARRNGAAILALRNCHHIGRVGHFAEQCADAGLVSIFFVNVIGVRPAVAPWGGSDARLLTNPFCIGIPDAGRGHLVLDCATSRVALGKVRVAMAKAEQVGDCLLIGPDGMPTRDPAVLYVPPFGAILPFGEHKGYGLGLVIDILAGALTGGGGINEDSLTWDVPLNNALVVLLDPVRLGNAQGWYDEMHRTIGWVTASPPAPGVDAILVPGDPERRSAADRAAAIPLEAATMQALRGLANELGVSFA